MIVRTEYSKIIGKNYSLGYYVYYLKQVKFFLKILLNEKSHHSLFRSRLLILCIIFYALQPIMQLLYMLQH